MQWIKERFAKGGLVCLQMGAPDMLHAMERAISEGQTVLMENLPENAAGGRQGLSGCCGAPRAPWLPACFQQRHRAACPRWPSCPTGGVDVDAVLQPVITRATFKKASGVQAAAGSSRGPAMLLCGPLQAGLPGSPGSARSPPCLPAPPVSPPRRAAAST